MAGEFELIERYFRRAGGRAAVGIGDDAAVLIPPAGHELVVTTDMLTEGVHFFAGADPRLLGHKSLAVNLSDLAAMGAQPTWATLSLSMPHPDENWLAAYSSGLFGLLDAHGVELIGGDTCRGPLCIVIQAGGWVEEGSALLRNGASVGDSVWVSGSLGDAALGLMLEQGIWKADGTDDVDPRRRLHAPEPRVGLGRALRGLASAAIDVSDGLLADLGHLLKSSATPGADIELEHLPLSAAYRRYLAETASWDAALAGGEDYELCFTAPDASREAILEAGRQCRVPCTGIGTVTAETGIRVVEPGGAIYRPRAAGFAHF